MNIKKKIILILIGLLVSGIFFYAIQITKNKVNTQEITSAIVNFQLPDASPTPFEFQEITISQLRKREFKSLLSELRKYSENSVYTSYLASYNSDGLKVNGLLTVPKSEQPTGGWPAIVFVHGYIPPARYQTTVNYSSYVDYLARNGFVVFKIDLRGHGDSEGEPGGAFYSADYIIDTLNAYSSLQSFAKVNPDKIGLWGHSMSGNVLFRALAVKPEIPAVVIWAGAVYTYSDMQEYRINDGSYLPPPQDTERQRKRRRLRELYGDFSPDSWFWQQVAATNYINDLTGALQINHAVDDNVVSINYSRNLQKLLQGSSLNFELKEYQTGGHNISGSAFTQAMNNTVDFYKKHL